MLVRERVGGAVAAGSGRAVPDCDAVQTILARLPTPMHGSCERMDGRLQRDTRVYYWQQTGAPAPNGPGARTSRDRTVRPQPEGFATTLCSPILEERFAVCGGEEIAVEWWYHRLLVNGLVLLPLPSYQSVRKSCPEEGLPEGYLFACDYPTR